MNMAHTELDLRERRAIEDMLDAKVSVSKTATEYHRKAQSRTLVGREYVERHAEIYPEVLKSRPRVIGPATIVYYRHEALPPHAQAEPPRLFAHLCAR